MVLKKRRMGVLSIVIVVVATAAVGLFVGSRRIAVSDEATTAAAH